MEQRGRLIIPLLVLLIGIAWLLNVAKLIPGVDWIWTCGLGFSGILVFFLHKINRSTLVVGGFLIAASICSLFRQSGKLAINWEVPILIIILGLLMLFAQFLSQASSNK